MSKKNERMLLESRAVNKIGNVMYDYGNSTWIAAQGIIGQKYLGYYQLAENVISLILNPIGGAVADRFRRRRILLTTDFIGGVMCMLLALIGNNQMMLYGLIAVNAILAMMHAFSGTSFKSYVVTVVDADRLVKFNARLEVISQIVSISSPLLAFLVVDRFGLKVTLVIDGASFFASFLCLFFIRAEEEHVAINEKATNVKTILEDIKEGLLFVVKEKEIFFLLIMASFVNFFIAGYNYLAPFSNQLFGDASSYAMLLTMGAVGAILGALCANKIFPNSYGSLLVSLGLCGAGLVLMGGLAFMQLPVIVIVSGNLVFEFFLTTFNIHFFSMVQKKVPNHMLGRVFSSIFTVAIVCMPFATAIMTTIPYSVNIISFVIVGLGIIALAIGGMLYLRVLKVG